MNDKWVQSSVGEDEDTFWILENTPNYIVCAFLDPKTGLSHDYFIINEEDESIALKASAETLEDAKKLAEAAYEELSKSAFSGNVWALDETIKAYTSLGDRPQFECTCKNKLALAEGMTICPSCDEQWVTWSVNSNDKTASPVKNFVRNIAKRDNVILAGSADLFEDNTMPGDHSMPADRTPTGEVPPVDVAPVDVDPVPPEGDSDDPDTDTPEGVTRMVGASLDDEEFIKGYEWADTKTSLPEKFSFEFKSGYIARLEERLSELNN